MKQSVQPLQNQNTKMM